MKAKYEPKAYTPARDIYKPNVEAARLYSCDKLVENTPASSVHRAIGCFALYKSAATRRYYGYMSERSGSKIRNV